MKKRLFIFASFIVGIALVCYAATDWGAFVSGRNNIRLDGYDGQPGYIEFMDGDGNSAGFLFADDNGRPRWREGMLNGAVTSGALDQTTTKISETEGTLLDYQD